VRSRINLFTNNLIKHLTECFESKITEFNTENPDHEIKNIEKWYSGFYGVASGLDANPGALILISNISTINPFFDSYHVNIAIAISADDQQWLEEIGRAWSDILLDSLRTSWTLGGLAVMVQHPVNLSIDCTASRYIIEATFDCEVDLGGFVYEGNGEAVSAMWTQGNDNRDILSEVSPSDGSDNGTEQESDTSY
jgi:hypothetical protein